MTAPWSILPFAAEEFEDRLAGLREAMEVHGLDACVLTSPWNVAYYAGLSPAPLADDAALVVTGDTSVILAPARAASRAARGFGAVVVHDGGRDDLWRAAAEVAGTGKAIGCEANHLTLMQSEKLNSHLKPRRGLDIALAAMQQRMVKSAAELALIRAGTGIAAEGLQAMRGAVAPGMAEAEIAARGRDRMEAALADLLSGDEAAVAMAFAQSGPNSADVAALPTRRRLKPGDPVGLTAAVDLAGYLVSLKDCVLLPDPSDKARRTLGALHALRDRLPALVLPGMTCGALASALQAELGGAEGWMADFGGGLAHEPILALRPGNETVLESGMILCLSPMCLLPDGQAGAGGYGLQTLFLITETGAEPLVPGPDRA